MIYTGLPKYARPVQNLKCVTGEIYIYIHSFLMPIISYVSLLIDFPSFVGDIGGSLGLWLGGSVLTFFEFFDLFSNSIYVYTKRVPNRR